MKTLNRISVAMAALTLAGCAMGPDWVKPKAPESTTYSREAIPEKTISAATHGGESQRFVQSMDIPAAWWTLFHSPALNALVERSLKKNPNIAAAQAALRQAEEGVSAQQGFYFPTLQANMAASRQRNTNTLSPTLAGASPPQQFNLYTPQLSISYAPDVFGLNRRAVESAQAQADAQHFQLEATYLTLASNVVVAALQEASLRAQLQAIQQQVSLQSEQAALYHKQFDLGATAFSDVVMQEAVLAQTRAQLPLLQKALAQQRDLITALAGEFPQQEPIETFELTSLTLPGELPVSLPAQLVEQRPDVRAAEEALHAASAEIGVATANLLPQFSITGAMGGVSTQLSNVISSGNVFWAATGGITQTLFDGGTLTARRRGAIAAYDQAAAQYRATVLAACQNVADTLRALEFDAMSVEAQLAAERAAAEGLDITTASEKLGSVSYLAVIQAQQNYEQANLALIQAKVSRFMDTAALYQALGGGWWNKPATSKP
jgi:NodT family efflux transporter outer membrane factor (OMF) lipoprotein